MKIVFVQRPTVEAFTVTGALRATAKNGKALQLPYPASSTYATRLRREGLLMRQTKRGKFWLAWCENGGPKKKGAR